MQDRTGCACPSSDARTCIAIRYGRDRWCDDPTEPCECSCHQEDDDDECYCDFASREFFGCFDRSHAPPCPQAPEAKR